MCTAVSYKTKDHYFGRTLDFEHSYGEQVVITPRNYPLTFRYVNQLDQHYALIGMAIVAQDYPLYYEATNEKGLSMAGLNFPGNAAYFPCRDGADNVTPFEFIPWILGQCDTVAQARTLLDRINLADTPFSESLPLFPLHWMISDRDSSITVESVRDGLRIYDNPVGVLTNNPPFEYHLQNLNQYLTLSPLPPENQFSNALSLHPLGQGLGMMGMPGDLSPASRFIRVAFTKFNSVSGDSEGESVGQFFHILGAVSHPRGSVHTPDGGYEITVYTSCCNTDRGIYYYTTYENRQITGVDMHREDLNGTALIAYPLVSDQQIKMQN